MKSQVTIKYNNNEDTYNIRIRLDEMGFQDEIVLKVKPTVLQQETIPGFEVTLLKDTSNSGEPLNEPRQMSSAELLTLMMTGGY